MRTCGSLGLVCSTILITGCATRPNESRGIQTWGSTRQVLHEGDTRARIALKDLPLSEQAYGVGALAGLAGEITIDGGTVWISEAHSATNVRTTRNDVSETSATLLILGNVSGWLEHEVDRNVPAGGVDDYLAEVLADLGRLDDAPLPFIIEGPVVDLRLHVIAGECPIRARRLGRAPASGAFEHRTDHGMVKIIGMFDQSRTGRIAHMGSATHMYVLLPHDGETMTGHVEVVGLAKGAVLRIPS